MESHAVMAAELVKLRALAKQLAGALEALCNELHKGRKLDVRKDFSLLAADAQGRTALAAYEAQR